MSALPVLFVAHGAPPLLDDKVWQGELAAWAASMPRPRSILIVSAHWEARPTAIGATRTVPLVYDFYNFPERYYQVTYPSPGAPELAERVRGLFAAAGIPTTDDPDRGLDHGSFVPLLAMYPGADIPVLTVSMPTLDPKALFAWGKVLAPLRDEGVLVIGSGFLTHNLRAFGTPGIPTWASEFDAWVGDTLVRRDHDALIDFMAKAPGARNAHPRTEHFVPLLIAAGAASDSVATFPITGWWMNMPFTRRSVQFS